MGFYSESILDFDSTLSKVHDHLCEQDFSQIQIVSDIGNAIPWIDAPVLDCDSDDDEDEIYVQTKKRQREVRFSPSSPHWDVESGSYYSDRDNTPRVKKSRRG